MQSQVFSLKEIQWWVQNGREFPESLGFVLVDRSTRWGNPFKLPHNDNQTMRLEAIEKYRQWIFKYPLPQREVQWLWGRHLVCHCSPQPCHADVLLRYVNFHYQP